MPARTVENLLTMDSTCVSAATTGQLDDNLRLALQFSLMGLRGNDEPASSNAQELSLYRKRSPNVTECVRVPSSEHVAEIVGRQGCKIKALRARTNTYIKTPVRGEEPVFVITGRKEDVGRSKYEILLAAEHFTQLRAKRHAGQSQTEAPAPSTSQPAPASLCPSTSSSPAAVVTPFTSLIAPSSVHAALAQFASIPGNVTVKLAVPVKIVGLIVGPKGATIKRIQQETKTYILTPSRDKDAVFEITGAPEGVDRAKQEIEQHVQARTGCTVPELLEQQAAMLGSARPSLTGSCAESNSSSSSANSSVSESLLFGGANLMADTRRVSPTRMALLAALNSKGNANANGSSCSRLPASKILVDHAGVRGELANCSSFQPLDQMCANEFGREQHSKLGAQHGWPSAFSAASGDQFSQLFTADKNVNEPNGTLNGHVLGRPNGSSWSQEGDGIADLLTKFAGTAPSSLIEAQHLCGLEQRDTMDGELSYFTNGGHRDSASSGINLESSSASNASNGQLLFTGAHLFMNEQPQQHMRILNADRPFLIDLSMNGNGASHDGTDSLIAQTIGFGLMRASEEAGRSDSVLM